MYKIPNDDREFGDVMHNARRKLESMQKGISYALQKFPLEKNASNANEKVVYLKKGFNTSRSISDHKKAVIEAQRLRVEKAENTKIILRTEVMSWFHHLPQLGFTSPMPWPPMGIPDATSSWE